MNRAAAPLRYLAAALLLLGGLVHLKLYFDGYRDFPDANLGRSFLLNAVASAVVAVAVAVRRDVWVRLAGLAVAGGTLVAFAISRTDRGIFGLSEEGLNPSPEALIALVAEVGAIVVLVVLLLTDRASAAEAETPRTALLIAVGVAALTLVLGGIWNRDDTSAVTTTSPATTAAGAATSVAPASTASSGDGGSAVAIAEFAFAPQELTVTAGSEVTWTNNDGIGHSVVADDGSFASDDLDTGATFATSFETPGTFTYLCGIHSSMKGTVTVT